jgi:ATP-binding cassette, subfamily F, member 3
LPLLTLSKISKMYGVETIIDAVSLQLQPGEKAGLIGPNGSGKTTLVRIIAGELEADSGEVHLARDTRIGYLAQESPQIGAATLRSHLQYPLRHIYQIQEELEKKAHTIATRADKEKPPTANISSYEEDLESYTELTTRFEEAGGYLVESKLVGVARGLGFVESDFTRSIATFSGGEKTRARLAGLLLQDLDLLLLDEPTNFLDLAALEWLEKHLREINSALLVVSHDRYFLDRVVDKIFALKNHHLKSYKGNYSDYRQKLEHEQLSLEREYKQQQLLKSREERLVREAKADERSKRQARSRQKRLDNLVEVDRPDHEQSFSLGIGFSGRSGRLVVGFEEVSLAFDATDLFSNLTFEIRWGDRLALIGPNGAGKTTLLKLIAGEIEPDSGTVRLGPAVKVLYFSQEQEQLQQNRTLLETITAGSQLDLKAARNHLGRYLFRGDDVFKKVSALSGGEKSRLALARLALSSGNCLLMDEPTSHLDLPALEELEKVLMEYPGTLIVVSHDRYFLKGLANRVFSLAGDGSLQVFEDSFAAFLDLKSSPDHLEQPIGQTKEQEEKLQRQQQHRERQRQQKEARRLKNIQLKLEDKIAEKEEVIIGLEATLSSPELYGDHTQLSRLGAELETARSELDDLLEKWEDLATRLITDNP